MTVKQSIEKDLWKEFEAEITKVKKCSELQLNSGKIISKSLRQFWEKFLSEQFPTGKINETLEKNFAIWLCHNNINVDGIREKYKEQNWKAGGLLGWIKKVGEGEIVNFNIKELLDWSNKNDKFEVDLLENAKIELEKSSKFRILTDNELEGHQSVEATWIVDRILGAGKITILGSKRANFKTYLTLQMIYSVAHGLKFLGQFKTTPVNILYADRENGFDELKKRRQMIKKGLGINDNSNIYFLSESDIKFDNTVDLKILEEFIISHDIKLVVGDTYRRLIRFDEDKANFVSNFFIDLLKPLVERTNCSFLFLAHEKKGESSGDDMDMLRGSSDLANYVDGIIQLSRKGNKIIVKQTKSRGAKEINPFQIEVQTDENTFFKFDYLGTPKTIENILAQLLIDWIIENKLTSFRYKEGLDFAISQRFSKNKYIEAIKVLSEQGLIEKGNNFKAPYNIVGDLKQLNLGEVEDD